MSSLVRQLLSSAAVAVFATAVCSAQNIAPAHSGTVHYFEGDVAVDGVQVVSQVARFTQLKEQSELLTGLGRAEILLTPGVLLRVGEKSSIKMLDNRLMSTRVELLSGTAMVEAMDAGSTVKDPPVTIVYKDFQVEPVHEGIFELTSLPGQIRVFKGEAKVFGAASTVTVREGNQADLEATTLATTKFDAKEGDDLYLWSRDRSAYLSAGNMSSARTLANSGYGNSAMGYSNLGMGMGNGYAYNGWNPAMWSGFSGGWYYNSYLNMYSFMPFGGTMYSPFGYGYYNPVTVVSVYSPGGYFWPGAGGSRTGTTTGVPLSTLPVVGTMRNPNQPLLPRLGVTAGTQPTLAAPIRGISTSASTASLSARSGFSNNAGSSGNNVRSAGPAPSAAPAPAARAAASPAGRR